MRYICDFERENKRYVSYKISNKLQYFMLMKNQIPPQ